MRSAASNAWRASVAIAGSRHTGKTALANALLGHHAIDPDTFPADFPITRIRSGPRREIEARGAECIAYVPDEPLLDHLEFLEVRIEDNSPLPECDIMLLLVSARAPLFDGALQFLKRVRNPENLLIVVTHMSSFPPAHGESIVEHVAARAAGSA